MKTKHLYVAILIIIFSVGIAFAGSQTTSSTTAGEIVDQAEFYLNDSDNEFWEEEELIQWVNDGIIDIITRTHCLQETESIDLAADTIEYAPSANFTTVKDVVYVNASSVSKGLKKGSVHQVNRVDMILEDSPEPVYWYEFNGKIGVYPPLSSRTTETITAYLVTLPTVVSSGGSVSVPRIYDKALVYYVVAQALFKDKQSGRYNQMMALYYAELDRFRQDIVEHQPEEAK